MNKLCILGSYDTIEIELLLNISKSNFDEIWFVVYKQNIDINLEIKKLNKKFYKENIFKKIKLLKLDFENQEIFEGIKKFNPDFFIFNHYGIIYKELISIKFLIKYMNFLKKLSILVEDKKTIILSYYKIQIENEQLFDKIISEVDNNKSQSHIMKIINKNNINIFELISYRLELLFNKSLFIRFSMIGTNINYELTEDVYLDNPLVLFLFCILNGNSFNNSSNYGSFFNIVPQDYLLFIILKKVNNYYNSIDIVFNFKNFILNFENLINYNFEEFLNMSIGLVNHYPSKYFTKNINNVNDLKILNNNSYKDYLNTKLGSLIKSSRLYNYISKNDKNNLYEYSNRLLNIQILLKNNFIIDLKENNNLLKLYKYNDNLEEYLKINIIKIRKYILKEKISCVSEFSKYHNINHKIKTYYFDDFYTALGCKINQKIMNKNIIVNKILNTKKYKNSLNNTIKYNLKDVKHPSNNMILDIKNKINKEIEKISDLMLTNFDSKFTVALAYVITKTLKYSINDVYFNNNILNNYKNIKGNIPFIYVPTHKSYFDFLILSYYLSIYRQKMPLIASADDLGKIPIIGKILKNSGAFFIQRKTIQFPKLYRTLLSEYISIILEQGLSIEFFIEGTRSRVNKIIKPKFGILKYILQAVWNNKIDDCYIIPINFNYENVIEKESLIDEWSGKSKYKETFFRILKAIKIFKNNYGGIVVETKEPISLKEIIKNNKFNIELDKHKKKDLKNKIISDTAQIIINELHNCTVALVVNIIAIIFSFNSKLNFKEFYLYSRFIIKKLEKKGIKIHNDLYYEDKLIKGLERFKFIKINKKIDLIHIKNLKPNEYFDLIYYKNPLFYIFLNDSILYKIFEIMKKKKIYKLNINIIWSNFKFLKDLTKNEISFNDNINNEEDLKQYILSSNDLIKEENEYFYYINNKENEITDKRLLTLFINPFIECYIQIINYIIENINNNIFESFSYNLISNIRKKNEINFYKGVLFYPESFSFEIISNFINYLISINYIKEEKKFVENKNEIKKVIILESDKLKNLVDLCDEIEEFHTIKSITLYKL